MIFYVLFKEGSSGYTNILPIWMTSCQGLFCSTLSLSLPLSLSLLSIQNQLVVSFKA